MLQSAWLPYCLLLYISGPPQNVTNLIRNASTLSWDAPFSLDLTNADPDIVYCVEVYNITCGRRDLIISDCNVTEPSYTSDDIAPDGYIYEYTVTPRSNVEGARNGTDETEAGMLINYHLDKQLDMIAYYTDSFLILKESSMGHSVSMMNITEMEYALGNTSCHMNVSTQVTLHLDMLLYDVYTVLSYIGEDDDYNACTFILLQGAIRPASYSLYLDSLDDLNIYTHDEFLDVTAFSYEETAIVLKVAPLPFRRLWNVTVFAYDCDNHPLMEGMELGL